jgi:lysophospholipase L1-like esterase
MKSNSQSPYLPDSRPDLTHCGTLGDARHATSSTDRCQNTTLIRLLAAAAVALFAAGAQADDNWYSAWTISIAHRMGPAFTGANFAPDVSNTSLRMVTRPTIAGKSVRVKLENTQATTPVTFTGAYVGKLGAAASIDGRNYRLTFGGSPSVTLGPGTGVMSDPVKLDVAAFERLAVSLEVGPGATEVSGHQLALATNYIGPPGAAAGTSGAGFAPVPQNSGNYPVYYVAAVDVQSSMATGTIVALGDSITDGRCSTRDHATGNIPADEYNRWTDVLSQRLQAAYGDRAPAVANQGIAGNRVVLPGGNGPAAVLRLDNDVLDRAGIKWVLMYEGSNDIAAGATTAQLIAGTQEIIDRVKARGIPIYVATVIARGRPAPLTGIPWTGPMEQVKLEFNHWLHTQANVDGIIEFGSLLAGPIVVGSDGVPVESMWDAWNCFDYIHPNKLGLEAMGKLIDLSLF